MLKGIKGSVGWRCGVTGVTCRVTCKPEPEVKKSRLYRSHASQCERAEAICEQNVCAV